jgi:hypothetical protein
MAMSKTATTDPADLLTQRLMVPLSPRMLEQIVDYRFGARIGSQSAAIRQLIAAGLEAERKRARK